MGRARSPCLKTLTALIWVYAGYYVPSPGKWQLTKKVRRCSRCMLKMRDRRARTVWPPSMVHCMSVFFNRTPNEILIRCFNNTTSNRGVNLYIDLMRSIFIFFFKHKSHFNVSILIQSMSAVVSPETSWD